LARWKALERLKRFLTELWALDEESRLRRGLGYGFWVPFVPSPLSVVRRMLGLAELKPSQLLYDLGAGDGAIVTVAAAEFGARAIGIEIRADLAERGNRRIAQAGLEGRARIISGDLFSFDLHEADIVALYLYPGVNERLRPKLERELRPGAKVVSHDYPIAGWTPSRVERMSRLGFLHRHTLYLYEPSSTRASGGLEEPAFLGRSALGEHERVRHVR